MTKVKIEVEVGEIANAILEQLAEEDVVKVVRCKDCVHWGEDALDDGACVRGVLQMDPDWFCADGERRSE